MKLQDSNVRSRNVRHLQEKYWSVFRRVLLKITKVSVISFYSTPKNDLDKEFVQKVIGNRNVLCIFLYVKISNNLLLQYVYIITLLRVFFFHGVTRAQY